MQTYTSKSQVAKALSDPSLDLETRRAALAALEADAARVAQAAFREAERTRQTKAALTGDEDYD